jgi:sulfatase modifying factor 1
MRARGACLLVVAFGCGARQRSSAPAAAAPLGAVAPPADTRSEFGPTIANAAAPPGPAPSGMVWIPGGEFSMGGDATLPDAHPVHRVYVDGFWMDRTEVTNADFARFVRATHYRTVAERALRPEDAPGAPPEKLVAGSVVFTPPAGPVPLDSDDRWWSYVARASWRRPSGSTSGLGGRDRYPVVQVAYEDAEAYARWAGKRLPTEAEFEFAARGGLAGRRYAWGDELRPDGRWMANTFQGHFPDQSVAEDGFARRSPVRAFPPNGYGLYDMAGNVWQWTADWYSVDYFAALARAGVTHEPTGPARTFDPGEPYAPKRVTKGGSFLCNASYCESYRPSARRGTAPDTGSEHVGFRCVKSGAGNDPPAAAPK